MFFLLLLCFVGITKAFECVLWVGGCCCLCVYVFTFVKTGTYHVGNGDGINTLLKMITITEMIVVVLMAWECCVFCLKGYVLTIALVQTLLITMLTQSSIKLSV